MVSHYVVDGIEIGGLIIGALGVLYLSSSLLGKWNNWFLRDVFPTIFISSLFAITVAFMFPAGIVGGWIAPQYRGLEAAVVGFLIGMAFTSPRFSSPISRRPVKLWINSVGIVAGLAILGIFFTVSFLYNSTTNTLLHVLLGVVEALAFLTGVQVIYVSFIDGAWEARRRAQNMDNRQLQIIGLILTFVGIASQFTGPILDLMNISVK